jgi:hypothetical protein
VLSQCSRDKKINVTFRLLSAFCCNSHSQTVMRYALRFYPHLLMPRTRGFQLVALQNLDRLLLKSMLGMIERHLNAKWVETTLTPTVVFSDGDSAEGSQALDQAKRSGLIAIAVTNRAAAPWPYLFRRPMQSRELMTILNQIDADQASTAESYVRPASTLFARSNLSSGNNAHTLLTPTSAQESALLRKAGNLFQYLVRGGPRTIVDVRFAPGRSVMFNHAAGEYCSAILPQQLVNIATQSVQETAHGEGQANAEWKIAKRMLPTHAIEDLTWRVTLQHSNGAPLQGVAESVHSLARLPRLQTALTPAQLSMAKMLTRTPANIASLARSVGVSLNEAIDFCNAAQACGLLRATEVPMRQFPAGAMSAALLNP